MAGSAIRGAVVPPRPDLTPDDFDRAHGSANELMWQMSRQAYGADYPDQVQPWGMTTWWTLGRFVAGLRVGPGQSLLDLACGRGGVGLWLARATGAELTGVDFSPVAVAGAAIRATEFVPQGRARFTVGDLTATGLPAGSMDGAVCADAVFFATDRVSVFAETRRILRPGARFLFTADESDTERPSSVPDWAPLIEAGGLIVDARDEIPRWREGVQGMYDIWIANIDEVRDQLGDQFADDLVDEATHVGPTLATRTGVLYTARRP